MTTLDYMQIFRDRWRIAVTSLLIGVLAALAVFILVPTEYTAKISLYVAAQPGNDPQQAFQGAQLSEQRVKSYSELIVGQRVLDQTINQLRLRETPTTLAKKISTDSAVDSVILDISVTDTSPAQAALIANTLAESAISVIDELERPLQPTASQAVAVRAIQPALPPTDASSTGLGTTLIAGAIIGIIVGAVAALLRNATDKSIKTAELLANVAASPNLGVILFDPSSADNPVTVSADPQSPRAEAYRQLRTNLQFVDVDNPPTVLVVTSSVAGEGKTTTIANLAMTLALAGGRVLVIEGDMRRPKLSNILGLDRSVGLSQILSGRIDVSKAVQPWGGGTFDVLSSGSTVPNPSELLASNQMSKLIETVKTRYDYVLIDTPPLLPVTDATAVAPKADGTVLVCRYKRTKTTQVEVASARLSAVSQAPIGTILTMVPERNLQRYLGYSEYSTDTTTRASQTAGRSSGVDPQKSAQTPHSGPRTSRNSDVAERTTRIQSRGPQGPQDTR